MKLEKMAERDAQDMYVKEGSLEFHIAVNFFQRGFKKCRELCHKVTLGPVKGATKEQIKYGELLSIVIEELGEKVDRKRIPRWKKYGE